MSGAPHTDLWRVGLAPAPIAALADPAAWAARRDGIVWLPEPGPWRYYADPFGIHRGGTLHVFVESFDYRTKHAVIEHHAFDPRQGWTGRDVALARPFHLSYPFIVEDGGEIFMIPESHRAGEIALYRARRFPQDWIRETALLPGVPGAEPSLFRHEDRWWMCFSIVGPQARDQRELHLAFADKLTGPWRLHPQNPIVDDRTGARPGGTPFATGDGAWILPVQDCGGTYGGALRFLRLSALTPEHITVTHLPARLTGGLVSSTHTEGMHTLSGCGDVTLFDVKRIDRSWRKLLINLQRRFRRLIPPARTG